jgi:S1-C subfamily serine protease
VAGTRTAAFEGLGVRIGGDAIVAINGQPVTDAEDVVRIVANSLAPGQTARFTLVRGRSRRTVLLRLGQRAAAG